MMTLLTTHDDTWTTLYTSHNIPIALKEKPAIAAVPSKRSRKSTVACPPPDCNSISSGRTLIKGAPHNAEITKT